jgi:hypothetical protein
MENIKIIKASTEDICRIMEIVNRHSELNSRISSGKYLLFGNQYEKIIRLISIILVKNNIHNAYKFQNIFRL